MNAALSELNSAAWYGTTHPSYGEWLIVIDDVIKAVAAKRGVDRKVVADELHAKATKKATKENARHAVPVLY
jgi:hypothetical protein